MKELESDVVELMGRTTDLSERVEAIEDYKSNENDVEQKIESKENNRIHIDGYLQLVQSTGKYM